MTELPDDILRAFAELPREREPDPELEERVVRKVFAPRRRWAWGTIVAAAAAAVLLLVIARPGSRPQPVGQTYVLLLSPGPAYRDPPPGHMGERRAEYARWADSLSRLGKLDVGGRLEGEGLTDGLFIIRAANDSDAARIAATCPHIKYQGYIEVRRFIE
jgi:hypothetical protein